MFLFALSLILADLAAELGKVKAELAITLVAGAAYVLQEFRHRLAKKSLQDIPSIGETLKTVSGQIKELTDNLAEVKKDSSAIKAELSKALSTIKTLETEVERLSASHEYAMIRIRVDLGRSEVGMFEVSPDGNMTLANRALCVLFGLPESDMLGRGWLVAVKSEERTRVWSSWHAAISQGIPYEDYVEIVPRDGRASFACQIYALPQLDSQRKVILYCGAIRRYTNAKKDEE